jgi:hypothetical protein
MTSCSSPEPEAAAVIQAALDSPSIARCTTDIDCVLASPASDCAFSCSPSVVVSRAGAVTLNNAVAQANAICGGDFAEVNPGCPNGPPFASCTAGTCRGSETPPPTWVSLSIEQSSGSASSTPPKCSKGSSCTLWTLTPDGSVVITRSGVIHHATLSAADLKAVETILQSLAFRQTVLDGFSSCDPAPAGTTVSMTLTYTTLELGKDVTGCVKTGPTGNDPQRLFQVLSAS